MSDGKVPRFLQQTTSQLLHQQEALRKRREMLERESTKPPAMRFGTNSPPRSYSRPGKLPAALSMTTPSTPPRGDNVHRELNWSRTEDESLAERAPMRFSMTFRPAPTPVSAGRPRSATGLHVPLSPSPREVNTLDRVASVERKLARDPSSPRTVSPRSPLPQRLRAEDPSVATGKNNKSSPQPSEHVPVQIFVPKSKPSIVKDSAGAEPDVEHEVTRAEIRQMLPIPPPLPMANSATVLSTPISDVEESGSDAPATGNTGFSNTFAVPCFTPITPPVTKRCDGATESAEKEGAKEEESENTPGRPAVRDFCTPRPVIRTSTYLTSVMCANVTPTTSSTGEEKNRDKEGEKGLPGAIATDGVRDGPSPVPTPSKITASMEASTEKRCVTPATPAMPRDHEECGQESKSGVQKGQQKWEEKFAPHSINTSTSRSVELRAVSPTDRTELSPAPTAQGLIQSVQASADRRPCGCKRPVLSPERLHRHRTTPSRPTTSPQPTPVPLFDKPMMEFYTPHRKCCDRPTPVSLSSQPAGGDARVTAAPSASPWPTTENIINSILACTQEEQRRAREGADDVHDPEDGVSERFSNQEGGVVAEQRGRGGEGANSPAAAPAQYPTDEEGERVTRTPASTLTAATHTPSPVPTERQYGQSVLASAERRRCGRPTPSKREVFLTCCHQHDPDSTKQEEGDVDGTSASPQPSAYHLLDSLDVSISKCDAREKPAERVNEEDEKEKEVESGNSKGDEASFPILQTKGIRTPSPAPTPENVILSLQASAEKRKQSPSMTMSKTSGKTDPNDSSTGGSRNSNSFQSPTLTPQNVKDSVQKLMRNMHQQQKRSDAQAPQRPWGESGSNTSEANWNFSASPVVTAEDVDMSLATLEKDQRRKSRSARADRDFQQSLPASPKGSGTESGTAIENDTHVSPQAAVTPQQPAVDSPAFSDFVAQSAMFFDCVSAPITPSVPAVETVVANMASTSRVPPQFFELQREISAISEGRGYSNNLPSLHASESSSPVPQRATMLLGAREDEDTPRAEASTELAITSPDDAARKEAEAEQQRRRSLILVQPTRCHQALIQHPHGPVPVLPPPTISPVRVPRTPTPPPRPAHFAAGKQEAPLRHPENTTSSKEESGKSPLPRPVPLRSQIALPKRPPSQLKVHYSRTPVTSWPMAAQVELQSTLSDEESLHQHDVEEKELRVASQPVVPTPHRHNAVATNVESNSEEEDLFGSKNDWMELVEPLRPHTLTVSPQGCAVVYTTHSPHSSEDHNAQKQQSISPSPQSRKRSRRARTPLVTAAEKSATTPASVALTMDDGTSTRQTSSDVLMNTPSSLVSQTPRSSTRGRRSQAEELMAMLPADVAAVVARMEEAEKDAVEESDMSKTRLLIRSPESRLSGLSEDDSTRAQMSTISQRVSQRPRRVKRSRDDYIEYFESIARSSAKKTRAADGRQMQKVIENDVSAERRPEEEEGDAVEWSLSVAKNTTAVDTTSAMCRSVGFESASTPSKSATSLPFPDGPAVVKLSPMVHYPAPCGRGRGRGSQLRVSTRLSTELQEALFRKLPTKAVSKVNPRNIAVAATLSKTKMAKKAATPSPKRCNPPKTVRPSPKSSPTPLAKKSGGGKKQKAARTNHKKKTARTFVTAKSSRLAKHGSQTHKKH